MFYKNTNEYHVQVLLDFVSRSKLIWNNSRLNTWNGAKRQKDSRSSKHTCSNYYITKAALPDWSWKSKAKLSSRF